MGSINEMWGGMAGRSRAGLIIGVILVLGMAIGLGVWAYRPDYQVLFSDMAPRDASAMTAELDRMKVPYTLEGDGNTILVPKDLVYKTRLKLMGTDIPLHGAVGFEVFNTADFGMTEFVQKVNYQRAVQGELTRTIQSIEDIQSARVHLALPEQGLFKKANTKPKASVTVGMKPGKALSREQILGIQRLVAASVPDISVADVTVLDQHGVALTRSTDAEPAADGAASQLDSKRGAEEYLLKKVNQVLDRTFGAGEAVASVDVLLNLDQTKVTTEEVVPAKVPMQEGVPTGVLVRERQTVKETGDAAAGGGMSTTENDYQVGRRIEQSVSATGTVKRMTIAVVVKKPLNEAQTERLKEVIAHAVGINGQRGDAVVVYPLDKLAATATTTEPSLTAADTTEPPMTSEETAKITSPAAISVPSLATLPSWTMALPLIVLVGVGLAYGARRRQVVKPRLSRIERERVLVNVQQWIEGTPAKSKEAL